MDLPETSLWWTTTHQQQNPSEPPLQHYHQPTTWFNSHNTLRDHNFNLNNQNDNDEEDEEVENDNDDENNNATTTTHLEDEKEPMFEKPLTPSDVGKLNRLVIPKQHAEKYFPLGGHGDSGECKGLLLSFEDESGKCWRFRYSYWNSSQSYVLTKGWSRYVKDKRLDAGDVVLFERHRVENQRLFINWRRRRSSGTEPAHVSRDVKSGGGKNEVGGGGGVGVGVGVGWTRGFYSTHPYPAHHQLFPYQQDSLHAGRGSQGQGERQRTKPVGKSSNSSSSSSSSSKVLRLFGVNMECQPEHHDHHDSGGPSTPSQGGGGGGGDGGADIHHLYHYHHQTSNSNPNPHLLRHQPYYY